MIRRDSGKDFLLITQTDHAAISGLLAKHLGNDRFSKVEPEIIAAIAAHDAGWPLHDDAPTLNADGLPLHVFETPLLQSIGIWTESVERAMALGPRAALLVSLHQLTLSDFATMSRIDASPRERFELNKFQHRQIELQESLRQQLNMRLDRPLHLGLAKPGIDPNEDRLRYHFRLLTLCDRLSLNLCAGRLLFPRVEEVYPRIGGPAIAMSASPLNDNTLAIDPWPFSETSFSLEVPYRRVAGSRFGSVEAFRAAFSAVPEERLRLSLHSI